MTSSPRRPAAARGAPKAAAPANSRQLLVELAAEAFAEQGYAGVSVRDLAARSDLTTGAIYHNFTGKPELLLAAIDSHIVEDFLNVPSDGAETVAGVLANIFAHYPDRERLRALLVEGAIAARSDHEVKERLREDSEQRLAHWTAIYRGWQEHGEFDASIDVHAVLVSLWAIELGFGVLEALGVRLPSTTAMGDVTDHFVRGLAPAPTTSRAKKSRAKKPAKQPAKGEQKVKAKVSQPTQRPR